MRLRWLLLGFVLAACNFPDCRKDPVAVTGTEWVHTRGRLNEMQCATTDDVEPNQNTSERSELASATCSGSRTVSGKVWGDVDTFHVHAKRCDDVLSARLDSGDGVRFCVFASCSKGTTALIREDEDAATASAAYGPEGARGRCRSGPGDVTVRLDCSGDGTTVAARSDVDVYLVLDHATTESCAPYAVTYRF